MPAIDGTYYVPSVPATQPKHDGPGDDVAFLDAGEIQGITGRDPSR